MTITIASVTELEGRLDELRPSHVFDRPASDAVRIMRGHGFPWAADELNEFIIKSNTVKSEAAEFIQALCTDWLRQVGEAGALSAAISTAIGSNRFLDLPDGGDVTLAEQVTRMRAALEEAETKLEKHEDRICRECEGRTYVPNRAARWYRDADGCDGTNDPEEVECPRCNGVGYEPPFRPKDAPRMPTVYDVTEEPF